MPLPIFISLTIGIGLFGFVLMFGAPYLPTMKKQTAAALDLLSLKPGQILLELGSGDGSVMRTAAARGYQVIGYELNPFLVVVSHMVTWRYRKQVRIIWANYWRQSWPEADGIFVFLLPRYMAKLNKKIVRYKYQPVRLASVAFPIPKKKISKEKQGVFLYEYS